MFVLDVDALVAVDVTVVVALFRRIAVGCLNIEWSLISEAFCFVDSFGDDDFGEDDDNDLLPILLTQRNCNVAVEFKE